MFNGGFGCLLAIKKYETKLECGILSHILSEKGPNLPWKKGIFAKVCIMGSVRYQGRSIFPWYSTFYKRRQPDCFMAPLYRLPSSISLAVGRQEGLITRAITIISLLSPIGHGDLGLYIMMVVVKKNIFFDTQPHICGATLLHVLTHCVRVFRGPPDFIVSHDFCIRHCIHFFLKKRKHKYITLMP